MENRKIIKEKDWRENETKRRAVGYAMSLISFQEVGVGPDENLNIVRQVVSNIRELCLIETGISLSDYPIDFIKENQDDTYFKLPLCFKSAVRVKENIK